MLKGLVSNIQALFNYYKTIVMELCFFFFPDSFTPFKLSCHVPHIYTGAFYVEQWMFLDIPDYHSTFYNQTL